MVSEKDLIGRTKEDAEILLTNEGMKYRIVREDDRSYIVTMDLRMDRFNLEIDNGFVTRVEIG